jgi:hybrid cluster-associated redox disulfide protein
MAFSKLLADLTVAEVMERWPQTIAVFFCHRMACVGCPIAPFETVAEAAAIYGLDPSQFASELGRIIEQSGKRPLGV